MSVKIYRDGNWHGTKSTGVEIYGIMEEELLQKVFEVVENEPDATDKLIKEEREKAEQKVKEVEERAENEVKEVVTPFRMTLRFAPDELVSENVKFLEDYETDKDYKAKDLFKYNGKPYRVIQDHKSQEDWKPDTTPAVYQDLSKTMDEEGNKVITEWKAPAGGHDLYDKGDKVKYDGKVWELVGKDTGHAPGVAAGVWKVVEE